VRLDRRLSLLCPPPPLPLPVSLPPPLIRAWRVALRTRRRSSSARNGRRAVDATIARNRAMTLEQLRRAQLTATLQGTKAHHPHDRPAFLSSFLLSKFIHPFLPTHSDWGRWITSASASASAIVLVPFPLSLLPACLPVCLPADTRQSILDVDSCTHHKQTDRQTDINMRTHIPLSLSFQLIPFPHRPIPSRPSACSAIGSIDRSIRMRHSFFLPFFLPFSSSLSLHPPSQPLLL